MDKLTLSTELINNVLQYLGNRPYVEVANLISGIQQEAAAATAVPPVVEAASAAIEPSQLTQE